MVLISSKQVTTSDAPELGQPMQHYTALLLYNMCVYICTYTYPTFLCNKCRNVHQQRHFISSLGGPFSRKTSWDLCWVCFLVRFAYMRVHVYICIYIYMWQRIKNIGVVTGLGGHFATKVCNRRGFCDKPLRDKPVEERLQYSTQRSATRVCNRGPATKVCNRGGGPRQHGF